MHTQRIDGTRYAQMLLGGAAWLAQHTEELNALNVFPVADGDTGTNMAKTVQGGLAEADASTESIGTLSKCFARGMLLAARGNSGVILSQIFAGIGEGLQNCDCAGAAELAQAYQSGIARSYGAVQNPAEGTILTVFRESAEYAAAHIDESSTVEDFFSLHIEQARRSLAATKEQLPALKEADVVDAGAAGYLYIAEGMNAALSGETFSLQSVPQTEGAVDIDRFKRDSTLAFGYCTECLLRLTESKVNPDTFDIGEVLSALEALSGESVVAYKEGDIVKVHVHTFTPGQVLDRLQVFGEFLTVKVENMMLTHNEAQGSAAQKKKRVGVVAVASGDGMCALFSQMGADRIVTGGQTANPSTEEFLEAFRLCGAEHILVLPNNKNVVLAAGQAAALYSDSTVHVIETHTLMQGYCALSVISDQIEDIDMLVSSAQSAAQGIVDGAVTQAVRDATIDGIKIKRGDYMALCGGKIKATASSAEEAVVRLLEGQDLLLCELITLFSGRAVSADKRAALTEQLTEHYEDCEITVYEGGQDIYDYFITAQ